MTEQAPEPGNVIQFKLEMVCPDEQVSRQVEINSKRDIPLFDNGEWPRLKIIANGPSARQAPLDGITMALNGAGRIFPKDAPPTYWAAVDPQELVSEFFDDPPEQTIYLIASKCHPKVFERLKGRKVMMWHVGDFSTHPRAVPSAMSITLCAMNLGRRMGYRAFDIYGWDACFAGDRHHASERKDEKIVAQRISLDVGGQVYDTTTTWAAEAETALSMIPVLEFTGAEVNIHGPSMVEAIRRYRAPQAA